MKKANFKAILAMLLVGVMGISVTACSGNGDTDADPRFGKQFSRFRRGRSAGTCGAEHRFFPRWYP